MIKVVDNEGNILAHIHINVVGSLKKIRSLIYQVCGQYPVNDSLIIILVKLCKSPRKQTKGSAHKNLPGLPALQLLGHIHDTLTRGNHVVDDEHVLTLHAGSQELMCHDGIAAAHDFRVIAALIEHTHVQPQHVGKIHGSSRAALIRTDDHHMAAVNLQVCLIL